MESVKMFVQRIPAHIALIDQSIGVLDDAAMQSNDGAVIKNMENLRQGWDFIRGLFKNFLDREAAHYFDAAELLRTIVRQTSRSLPPQLKSVPMNFQIDAGAAKMLVRGQEKQFSRAIINLLKNAAEAVFFKEFKTGAEKIDISVAPDARRENVIIVIRDEGMGISRENMERIFLPYFTTKGEYGTGLGMLIVREAIESHGGTLSIASTVDKGTTVTLTLPLAPDPADVLIFAQEPLPAPLAETAI
ncbi:MAG: ATP-binding protein [Candidatus Omnitrophica bacterium]|nr:ATP-binding protein [Candidatus Omnitrophota bacterium]